MQNNMIQMLMQLKSNPMAVLGQRFNLPQNVNDPNAILQHLLNTGQVSQSQVNQAMQMRNMFQK
jgi:hypothetical protein